ncbi:MAG TPA: hypothetical protein ENN38_00900 [Actinobacteria bacterium]|nr:hypothetical protein [Actinomycetota bacterium]
MSRKKGSSAVFGLGVLAGFGLILTLSPIAREIFKEKLSETVEIAKPYVQKYKARLFEAIEAGKEAAWKKEEELEEKFQLIDQESFKEEETPDYIV